MEQQVAMLLRQLMEVSDRLRLSEESSEQVRQLLEAHRTETSVRDTSQSGGSSAARAQEAPGADDGRFGFGAFAARYQPENFNVEDTGLRDWSRVFRTWQEDFNVDECKKSLEMRLQWLNWIFDSRIGQVPS